VTGAECVIFLGPPGAGKGTQAALLVRDLGFARLASGELLRDHVKRGTELGTAADEFMSKGELVPDELVTTMMLQSLAGMASCRLALDGYPKTRTQAIRLDQALAPTGENRALAVYLEVDRVTLLPRLLNRSLESGRTDDTPEVIQRRLELLGVPPHDLLSYYDDDHRLATIDGKQPIDAVHAQLREVMAGHFQGPR
jgi:adenylate kinase